jgi:hypothetical protein
MRPSHAAILAVEPPIRGRPRCVTALVVALLALAATIARPPRARADDADKAPRAAAPVAPVDVARPPDATPRRLVGEATPELFYVEDDAGRLVPVPGFRYRDFMDLFRMKEGLGGALRPPPAVLEKVVVRIDASGLAPDAGAARGSTPTVPATAEFTVRQSAGGWAAVALDLGGLLLAAPPKHEGPGRMLVDATADGGYRAWFDAAPEPGGDVTHTIVLEGRLPCDASPNAESFAVRLPVSVASRLEIRSARRDPAVDVRPAAPEQSVAAAADEEPGSVVSIAGLAGAARIRIADERDENDQRGAAAEAVTESTVRVDGRNAVIDAVIRLAQLPPGPARLRIALPPQATLRGVRPPAVLAGRGGPPDRPTIDVATDVDADGRAQVELSCERPVDPSGTLAFEAIGFAVDGIAAWRQWGRVSLVVEGDWRIWWRDATTLRRVDPPANVRQQGFVAAFAYDAQPASLPLEVRPRRSRVVIEPEYRYDVGAGRIALDARFRVAVRGAPVSSIAFAIDPAWSVDEVGPAGAVDSATVSTEAGEVIVPFAQALAGDTVIEVRASRPIRKEDDRVTWKLPVPRADLVGPAVVVIASQSDIELLPDNEGINGLVRQTAAAVALADADTSALVYRLDAAEGAFAATRRFLPRRVEAAIAARAALDAAELTVEQTIRLSVQHVPLEFIELEVPEVVAAAGTLEVRQNDALLDPAVIPAPADGAAEATATTWFRAILADPLLGEGDVTVRYRLPAPAIPPESTVAFDLPLVLPAEAGVGRQTVAVETPATLSLGVRGDTWRRDVAAVSAGGPQAFSAVKPQRLLPLTLSTRRSDATRTMVVEAAWLRTRLLPAVREDLLTYVVSAADERIALAVPAATTADAAATAEVRLDGEIVPGALKTGGRLVVELPRADPARRWRLDVRTTTARDRGWAALAGRFGLPAMVRLDPPVFDQPVLEKRFYWTIHARPDEHLVGLPSAWTSQQRWRPSFAGWRLVPAVTDDELAAWVVAVAGSPSGAPLASATPAAPSGGPPQLVESTFAYAGVGTPGAAAAWVVPNWFTVLVASGATLAAGLAVVYRPAVRRGWLFIAVTAGLGLAAAAEPEIAPLVAQAAAPGAVLAVVAWVLRFVTERRAAGRRFGGGVSASSLTQHRGSSPSPSLIVASSVADGPGAGRPRWP